MDESLQQLEDELKSLRLRSPSPQLVDRLTSELAAETDGLPAPARRYSTASNFGSWHWLSWRIAGVAAVLTVGAAATFLAFKARPNAASEPPARLAVSDPVMARPAAGDDGRDQFRPVAATNVLYDLKDEGLVTVEDGPPARQVRARYLDTYTWTNPRRNSSLKLSVPRDEIRVIPASLH